MKYVLKVDRSILSDTLTAADIARALLHDHPELVIEAEVQNYTPAIDDIWSDS